MIEYRRDGRLVDAPPEGTTVRDDGPGLLWIRAVAPTSEELDLLERTLGLHPLAVEDIRNRNQRPKVDEYPGQLFVVLFAADRGSGATPGAAPGDDTGNIRLVEVHVVVGDGYLCSIADSEVSAIAALARQCALRPEIASDQAGRLFYRICDAVVDSYFPLLDELDGDIDELETAIIQRADGTTVSDIFGLKRDLNVLRRVLGPQRDVLQGLAGPHGPALGEEAQLYLRDVYDHGVRIVEQVDAYRDIVTGALDVYLSSVSNRLGEQTRRLSVVATIFLPLTFFTGFFGQNFGFLVEHITSTRAFAVGVTVMAVSVMAIWLVVRRSTMTATAVPGAAAPGRRRRLTTLPRRLRVSVPARGPGHPDS